MVSLYNFPPVSIWLLSLFSIWLHFISCAIGDFADIRISTWVVCIISSGWWSLPPGLPPLLKDTSLKEQPCLPLAPLAIIHISQQLLYVKYLVTFLSGCLWMYKSCAFTILSLHLCDTTSQKKGLQTWDWETIVLAFFSRQTIVYHSFLNPCYSRMPPAFKEQVPVSVH